MSAIASLRDTRYEYFHYILTVLKRLIEAGADVNVVDEVSYHTSYAYPPCGYV